MYVPFDLVNESPVTPVFGCGKGTTNCKTSPIEYTADSNCLILDGREEWQNNNGLCMCEVL